MRIDVPDPLAIKPMTLDEPEHLIEIGHRGHRKVLQQFHHGPSVGQTATRDLADDEGMDDHRSAFEQRGQLHIAPAQVINPHRCIDEDQVFGSLRLRGAAFSAGWLPPKRAFHAESVP